jgi:hypothetical protein
MTFTAPLGLLALLALPAIIALHLFRNRLPEKRVAGLFLFPGTAVASDGGRKRTRLLHSTSLWLECLIALLLALWLAGFTFGDLLPRHVVLVVDDSASMGAVATRDRADRVLQELCDGLAIDDELTIVLTGNPSQVVVGPRATPDRLLTWMARWQPTKPRHSVQSALDLGREIAGHSGELILLTDEEPLDPCTDLRLICCGSAVPNAALSFVQRISEDGLDRVSVTIIGYGTVRAAELVVAAGSNVLARVPVELPKNGGEVQVEVSVPQAEQILRIELSADALAIDNVGWLVPTKDRIVSVCDRLSAHERERLELSRVFEAMTHWRQESDPSRAQVTLQSSPSTPSAGQIELVMGASAGDALVHKSPFILDRSHPLLSGIEMEGIHWLSGSRSLPGQVLVASGSKVLISSEATQQGTRIWCDVDGRAGNFVRSPDWPILFANVLEVARRQVPGCRSEHLRIGDELFYRCREPREPIEVRGPDGSQLAAGTGGLSMIVRQPGLYRVLTRSPDVAIERRELAQVAVRFQDPAESDLRRQTAIDRAADAAVRSSVAARVDSDPMRRVLTVLLLLIVSLNWWLMQRRVA